eukprot:3179075-Amphidinium_carterae.1
MLHPDQGHPDIHHRRTLCLEHQETQKGPQGQQPPSVIAPSRVSASPHHQHQRRMNPPVHRKEQKRVPER